MNISRKERSEPQLIKAAVAQDHRGWFTEIYSTDLSGSQGPLSGIEFVQDNVSLSKRVGTLRGLHFQLPPAAQGKLVTVWSGALFDVAVDIRRSSPRCGQYQVAELRAGTGDSFFVPAGYAHGFMTLEPDTIVFYKVSSRYSPSVDRGIAWDDSRLGINWPIRDGQIELSDRDCRWPRLDDAVDLFP